MPPEWGHVTAYEKQKNGTWAKIEYSRNIIDRTDASKAVKKGFTLSTGEPE